LVFVHRLSAKTNDMSNYPTNKISIKHWAEEDRPREKLLHQGKKQLSDAELIAIILGSGSREASAVMLAKQLLAAYDHDLHLLAKANVSELCRFKGIGAAKAVSICAALELSARRNLLDIKLRPTITSSRDAYQMIATLLADLPHEEFWILLLNRANRVIGRERVSVGGVAGTVVDAKLVFQKAIQQLASSIILAHNHPSGNLRPSQADIDLTKKLKAAGKVLDIQVLDHLIISEAGYTSLADEQLMGN
jgi:DNA repair protein RadC